MFTGLVEELGKVEGLELSSESIRILIDAPLVAADTRVSDSVCVNGVCLTVTQTDGDRLAFDAVPETLNRSSLGDLRLGSRVNLERSLAVGQRLGGHFVQGHVDATATILSIDPRGNSYEIALETDPKLAPLLVEKGSITLDGISLTLAHVDDHRFTVAIIPFTWEQTTLSDRKPGDRVNVEADILGKHVLRALAYLQKGASLPELDSET
ncbi:MAG: riboflavin synthase [Armatimonadetes bacterium]|nr:riboflavin synthase [Armatimonadota bacterium]